MATVTLRPDATIANGNSLVTGAATRHAALSDDSDSSYVSFGGLAALQLGFAEPSIPAGAVLKSIALRLRLSDPGGSGAAGVDITLSPPDPAASARVSHTASSIATITAIPAKPISEITAIVVTSAWAGSGFNIPRIYEAFADVVYVAKPVVDVLPMGV